MVNVKEFGVIRNKVLETKTALVNNIGENRFRYKPVVASAIHVEEDGHLWMLVNSKLKKWNQHSNIPVTVQFIPDDCQISLSGIGQVTSPENVPSEYQELAKEAKSVMKMKIYYGEYVPLPENSVRSSGPLSYARNLLSGMLELIMGRANRRLLIFR
jgi:hypothetical protein